MLELVFIYVFPGLLMFLWNNPRSLFFLYIGFFSFITDCLTDVNGGHARVQRWWRACSYRGMERSAVPSVAAWSSSPPQTLASLEVQLRTTSCLPARCINPPPLAFLLQAPAESAQQVAERRNGSMVALRAVLQRFMCHCSSCRCQ